MTVTSSTQSIVNPGRLQDAVALAGQAAKLLERHGASDVRLLAAIIAGEATGTLDLESEYPDVEGWGASSDSMVGDTELQQLMDVARGPNSPVHIVNQVLTSDIPLDRAGNNERGSIVEVHASRLTPGRMVDALEFARRSADYVEARGATHARLATIFAAGTASNLLLMTWEFPTLKAYGKLCDSWTSDPEGLALYEAFLGPDPTDVEIFSGIYQAIPL
jgi:hypothetical protein